MKILEHKIADLVEEIMKRVLIAILFFVAPASWVVAQPNAAPSLESHWNNLISADEGQATRALLALSADPKAALALMEGRLKPVKIDAKQVEQWLKQLDNANFATRSKATEELAYCGKYVKKDLEAALKGAPNLEMARRVQDLLNRIPKDLQTANSRPRRLIDQTSENKLTADPLRPLPMGWTMAIRDDAPGAHRFTRSTATFAEACGRRSGRAADRCRT